MTMTFRRATLVTVVLAALLGTCCRTLPPAIPDGQRPATWAQPITAPGVGNLFKVSDSLYRGEQPTLEGTRELERLGIRTVINLRDYHTDKKLLKGTGLDYVAIPMGAQHIEDEDVVRFLQVAADPARTPVFVHCQHGSDRTGTVVAAYRIVIQGWPNEEALREMRQGGYGFHSIYRNLIGYIRGLDAGYMRRRMEQQPAESRP